MPEPFPPFVCPRCRGAVAHEGAGDAEAYRCAPCDATYPVVFGIADFRVEPDPWIGLEDDRAKARRLIDASAGLDLAASVETYWGMTPGTPAEFARRFTAYVLDGERRAVEWLDVLGPTPAAGQAPWLEIGCASGDMLAVAADRGIPMVGVDVAMRWLVLARKRAALAGGAQRLVCANGEHLPFPDDAFAHVISVGTLEHCRRADDVLAESARVLRPGGSVRVRTTNRFTMLPEPHVDVWGVGFVPRRFADAYVRWRNGQRYLHHRPLSQPELARELRRAGFADVRVRPARLLAADRQRLGGVGRAIAPVYEWARSAPGLGSGLALVAPLLDSTGTAT